MPDSICFATTEGQAKSSGFSGFPFNIPDRVGGYINGEFIAVPVEVWDGTYQTTQFEETPDDLYKITMPNRIGEAYLVGEGTSYIPVTIEQASYIYWRARSFDIEFSINGSSSAPNQLYDYSASDVNQSISASGNIITSRRISNKEPSGESSLIGRINQEDPQYDPRNETLSIPGIIYSGSGVSLTYPRSSQAAALFAFTLSNQSSAINFYDSRIGQPFSGSLDCDMSITGSDFLMTENDLGETSFIFYSGILGQSFLNNDNFRAPVFVRVKDQIYFDLLSLFYFGVDNWFDFNTGLELPAVSPARYRYKNVYKAFVTGRLDNYFSSMNASLSVDFLNSTYNIPLAFYLTTYSAINDFYENLDYDAGSTASYDVSIDIKPHKYWPYKNNDGNPVWDEDTGEKINPI